MVQMALFLRFLWQMLSSNGKMVCVLTALFLSLLNLYAASASTVGKTLPAVVEEFRLLTERWKLLPPSQAEPRYTLVLDRGGDERTFPIEPAFIAQSLRGNQVDESEVASLVRNYVEQTEARRRGMLMVKLAALRPTSPIFVRSFKIFDVAASFDRASRLGSPVLNLEAADVKELGMKGYSRQINEMTAAEWQRLGQWENARKSGPEQN
jgi:hypothetical protein